MAISAAPSWFCRTHCWASAKATMNRRRASAFLATVSLFVRMAAGM